MHGHMTNRRTHSGQREQGRRTNFQKVASKRTEAVILALEHLGKCSNSRQHSSTQAEVGAIFDAIETALENCRGLFLGPDKQARTPFNLQGGSSNV